MSLHSTDALIVEGATAAESLPDPTTTSGRTHWLHNNFAGSQVWSSTGATPFVVNGVNSANLTILRGEFAQLYSDGTRWNVIQVASPASNFPPTILTQLGVVSTYDRMLAAGASALTSQLPFLSGFIAPKSMTVANMSVYNVTGTGTATSAYLALYSLAANGDATLVCTSANTTGLFSATGTRTAAMTSPTAIIGGAAYATYVYYNGAFSPQIMAAASTTTAFAHERKQPYAGVLRGASTVVAPPASLTYASGTAINSGAYYVELT